MLSAQWKPAGEQGILRPNQPGIMTYKAGERLPGIDFKELLMLKQVWDRNIAYPLDPASPYFQPLMKSVICISDNLTYHPLGCQQKRSVAYL